MWNFDRLISGDLTDISSSMVFDGRNVWVGNANATIDIFTYWDETTDYESLYSGYSPNMDSPANNMQLVESVDVSSSATTINQLVKVYDKIFTHDGNNLVSINITTKDVDVIDTPSGTNVTNILGANNKVWVITSDEAVDKDRLFFYDTITLAWSAPIDIPGQFQKQTRDMVWAHDAYVIVSGFNDNGVHKFNSSTGAYIGSTTINRKPTALTANNSRQVYVASYNGMVSTYNQVTNVDSNTDGILDEAIGMVDDGAYLWSISPYLSRKKKNVETDAMRLQSGSATHPSNGSFTGTEDYALESFGSNTFKQILITPEFTYEFWNGSSFDTRTVKQYVFLLHDTKLFAFRNSSLYRENYISVRATGMIGVGESGYYGETS